jgi:hypothetical protein
LATQTNRLRATVQTSRISLECHKHCTDDAAKYPACKKTYVGTGETERKL